MACSVHMSVHGGSGTPEDAIAAVAGVTREGIQAAAQRVRLDTVYLLAPEETGEAGESSGGGEAA